MNEIILELSALFIALFCLMDCLKKRKRLYLPIPSGWDNKLRDQHFTYMVLLVTLMISAVTSCLEVLLENYFSLSGPFILNLLNEIYFVFHQFISFVFTLYIINMTNVGKEKSRSFFALFLTPFFIGEILVFLNPVTGMLFYIDENMTYTRGGLIWVLYAIAAFYVLVGIVFFILYKKRLSRMDRTATLILITIAIMGIVIQALWSIPVELFFESIGFLGFLLLLEEKGGERVQKTGGRFNKSFIVVISLIFITVITININLIYHAGTDQTGKIGTIQLDNIKGSLQETISDAEGNLLRFSMGMEQLIDRNNLEEIEKYIREQKQYNSDLTGGNCFNVYAASSDWTIIPDFDMPEEYHAVERVWYIGAKQMGGEIYISEPYIDALTNDLCFTLSNLLSDGDVVTSMDYTFSKVQDTINLMSSYEDQTALIVTKEGTILGCSDSGLLGEKLSDVLPEYTEIFDRVKASKEHGSFTTTLNGKDRIIFSNETSNGWQLILVVDYDTFYADIYRQMIMLGAIDILMVAVIIVFYMVSLNNQEKAEESLAATESFISGFSEDFMSPVNNIVKTSELLLREEENDPANSLRDIRESGIRLKEMMNDLFSYSNILKSEAEKKNAEKKAPEKKRTFSSKYIRNGIIGILAGTLLAGLILCLVTTTRWGDTRISKEADKYNSEITQWMLQHQSILRMFTDVIAADPTVLDDYEAGVKWLNDIGQNYSEMSACYMANPYKEHAVTMNNGWVPDPDYRVEQRQWYIDTERSGNGYSISVPYYDAQTGLYCITFSRIVYSKEGEFLGIFAIDCYVDKLIDVLDDSYTKDGYAFLIDPDGNILNHPNKEYEMSEETCVNIEDTIYASAFHDGEVFALKDYDGSYVSCYSEKSEMSGFTVMVVQRWWSIYGSVLIMAIIFAVMLVFSIGIVVAMINRFIKWQEEANKRLVEAADAAVSAGKAKSRFLAQMSHEIRTPINAVLGMNEMILRESNDDSIKEYAVNIQSSGRNLLSLINSILDFSKIEEGKMEIIPGKYATSTLIETLINSVSQRAEDKGLIFETHIDEKLPSGLYGDDVRVAQIIVNLLTNAVKYTNKGRVDLYISGEKKDDKTLSMSVKVKDTGIGIKQEDLGKMFESFTRLEETRNRAIEGTGLGMSIVMRLLEMMGSKLEVESEYGKGSEFSFTIDQMITDITPLGNFKQKSKESVENIQKTKYLYAPDAKILVVDDNEMNLKVMKNLLKLNAIKPDMVSSGEEALEKLKVETYDIILLDHMMPKMDGIETLEKAKENYLIGADTTVIALTANAVVGARETYLKAGFDDYLSKPVEIKALEQTLAKYLRPEMVDYKTRDEITVAEEIRKATEKKKAERAIIDGKPEERRGEDRRQHDDRRQEERRKGDRRHEDNEGDDIEILEFFPEDEENDDNTDVDEKDIDVILNANGINTADGLTYCADDEEFYREILNDYANSSDDRIKELEEACAAMDLDNYTIKVHALKSVAKTVGDKNVFEMAYALEMAAKGKDSETVQKKHPDLIAEYKKKAGIIKGIFKK
jgi:signal transduction histidine kinase/CheY-like chemotaxis protein/HPt (histidine-containing phosphotransfer) domain-containing protein